MKRTSKSFRKTDYSDKENWFEDTEKVPFTPVKHL